MSEFMIVLFFLAGLLVGFVIGFLYGGWLAQAPVEDDDDPRES